jgi:hypothetical protein
MQRSLCIACGLALFAAGPVGAATIGFFGPSADQGTGFGAVLNVLSLQGNPNESGSVLWNGTQDVLTGDAANQSRTRTVSELTAAGITATSTLGVVLNLNEPGANSDVTLQGFTVRFFSPTGATLFDAVRVETQVLMPVNQGTGGAGHLFNVLLTPAESAAFFANPANRIGIEVSSATPILNSQGGPDNFYLVPAPGASILALAACGVLGRRRKR